jgi:hypothetical protein
MDSIPQELIDAIIDGVPHSSLPSCSLVAKRWRRTSQQRILSTISFEEEEDANRWCTDVAQNSDGISSYVRHVKIQCISFWAEPALFSRMLESLSSLTELSLSNTKIPGELPGYISCGEFGKRITALYLHFADCTLATVTSMILSLPHLKELSVKDCDVVSEELHPINFVTSQRKPLNSLELLGYVGRVGEALAEARFISSRLFLDIDMAGVGQLLMLSSETVVELKLHGVWFLWILRSSRDDSDRSSR